MEGGTGAWEHSDLACGRTKNAGRRSQVPAPGIVMGALYDNLFTHRLRNKRRQRSSLSNGTAPRMGRPSRTLLFTHELAAQLVLAPVDSDAFIPERRIQTSFNRVRGARMDASRGLRRLRAARARPDRGWGTARGVFSPIGRRQDGHRCADIR